MAADLEVQDQVNARVGLVKFGVGSKQRWFFYYIRRWESLINERVFRSMRRHPASFAKVTPVSSLLLWHLLVKPLTNGVLPMLTSEIVLEWLGKNSICNNLEVSGCGHKNFKRARLDI